MINDLPILLVEDDLIDVMAVKRAFRELKVTQPLQVAGNGEDALLRLRDMQEPLPSLILLDLNMPRMNGVDFLKAIKSDPRLRRIPVVVLTTSNEESDRAKTFDLGVAGYMVKGIDYEQFIEVVRTIQSYWNLSEMPPLS